MMKNRIRIILPVILVSVISLFLLLSTRSFADLDNDGIVDSIDNCSNYINTDQKDWDYDNQGDVCDMDDDNDGVSDALDLFDNDSKEWADFDFDGLGSFQDMDDDNDGIVDSVDVTPTLPVEEFTKKYQKN